MTSPSDKPLSPKVTAKVAAIWPDEGGRHEAYMALIGGLLRHGWSTERVENFLEALAAATEDEEVTARVKLVSEAADRLKRDEAVVGWPRLAELLGASKALKVRLALDAALTVKALANAKQLPVDFLQRLGVEDAPNHAGNVLIPYRNAAGEVVATRTRSARHKKPKWNKGAKAVPYGIDRIDTARAAGYLVLVEGESDCWTLWFHEVPALGIPGASCAKVIEKEHLAEIPKLYIVQEPDAAGEYFVGGIRQRLAQLGWHGELRRVQLDGFKDASEMHCNNPERFAKRWAKALKAAELVELPETTTMNPLGDTAGKENQATKIVGLVLASGVELWHDPDGDAYVTLPADQHHASGRLNSRLFREWVSRLFHTQYERTAGAQALQDALGVLSGKARFDGPEHNVFMRLAGHEGKVYLDLGDPEWQAVEIDATGWRVISRPPVRFRRARALSPLPMPEREGRAADLRQFVNVEGKDWPLVLAWLVAALQPHGPYPVLCLFGEQGSAKSTTARILRALVDPNKAPVRAEPRDQRDLAIAGNNSWVIALDNLSYLSPQLSDALCRMSTGGGFATRMLYEDAEETIFDAQRPVILNGIEEVVTRPDLLDRAILVSCPTIPEEERRAESDLWREFESARPRLLGTLLDAVAAGLCNLPGIKLETLPRMADFALWGVACEDALGLKEGRFLKAYTANIRGANDTALEASVVASPLLQFLEKSDKVQEGAWKGTAAELLRELGALVSDQVARSREWPKKAHALSGKLKRLAPNLRKAGVEIEFGRQPGGRRERYITLARKELKNGVPSVPTVPNKEKNVKSAGRLQNTERPGSVPERPSPTSQNPGKSANRDARDARDGFSPFHSNTNSQSEGTREKGTRDARDARKPVRSFALCPEPSTNGHAEKHSRSDEKKPAPKRPQRPDRPEPDEQEMIL